MKRLRIIPVVLIALVLAGCAGTKLGDFIATATAPITNPITPTNIYQVKLVFDGAVKGANRWANYCWSKSYAALMADPVAKPVCTNRRATRRQLSQYGDAANGKIKTAEAYIATHPTITPVGVVQDAWNSVSSFKNLVLTVAPPQ